MMRKQGHLSMRNFLLRVFSAMISCVVLVFAVRRYPVIGIVPFHVLLIGLSARASWEFSALTHTQPSRIMQWISTAMGTLLPFLASIILLFSYDIIISYLSAVLLFCATLFIIQCVNICMHIINVEYALRKHSIPNVPNTSCAAMQLSTNYIVIHYIGISGTVLILLAQYANGITLIFFGIIITATFDTCSYLCGVLFAKKRNILALSPMKSIAGYLGGSMATLCIALILLTNTHAINAAISSVLLIICLTIIAAIMGDLFESALKRTAHKKNSGIVVPGRGGLLDSIDSHLLAVPIFCLLCLLVTEGHL